MCASAGFSKVFEGRKAKPVHVAALQRLERGNDFMSTLRTLKGCDTSISRLLDLRVTMNKNASPLALVGMTQSLIPG